ncbi:MAG: sulfatase-like hydrolase/transferase, partial [Chloroflexota bacterium]
MGEKKISRRDFLKLISLVPASISVKPLSKFASNVKQSQPHIIIIVYDAWAARNTSLYGYPRATMPNLEKFAEKALVYHRHYAAGNFTVPGTASLLTGVYPWKHRAFALGSKIVPKYEKKQIFNLLANNYQTVGYSQNMWADLLLYQTGIDLHTHIPNNAFNIDKHLLYSFPFFSNDPYLVFSSLDKLIASNGSLLLGPIISEIESRVKSANQLKYINQYHKNLIPESEEQFLLSNVVDGAIQILKNLDKPSIVYIHLYPPHEPFRPKNEFVNIFSDTPETLIY